MDGEAPATGFARLRRAALRVWPGNPRKTVDPAAVTELAAAVRSLGGVKSPLLVRPLLAPEGEVTHEVIAGQRRFFAAGEAGVDDVPVSIEILDDAQALELALSENGSRRATPPLEDAEAIERLIVEHGRSVERTAAILGRSVRWVERRRALLNLSAESRAWAVALSLPLAHMEALAAVSSEVQARALAKASHLTAQNIPERARFLEYISSELHRLDAAPFDPSDADLGVRACRGCQRRSDAQGDLFDNTRGACCLDADCWTAKTDALWERALKDAKKRRLKIVPAAEVIAYDYGSWFSLKWDVFYVARAASAADKPVAVTRRETGHVVELYAKPAPPERADADRNEVEAEDGGDPAAPSRQAARENCPFCGARIETNFDEVPR